MTIEKFAFGQEHVYCSDGKNIAHLSLGGKELTILCGGKDVRFEMHSYHGPTPISKSTGEVLQNIPKAFWTAYDRWDRGGRLVNGDRCIVPAICSWCGWAGHKTRHLGGRHYEVIGKCLPCGGSGVIHTTEAV